ncbi:MAG: PQQ-like beta-propeller repeat protein, partial [Planctomycetes bacterium]|nr:PQQ-like beta-propeller repeat protein [Planctomycetota bacterium]
MPTLCRANTADTHYYRGNPNGTGYLKGTHLPTRPVVRWSYVPKAAGGGRAPTAHDPVAIEDGVVYCGDDLGRLYALSAEDGAVIWIHEHGQGQIFTPATIADDLIYFTCS